MDRRRLAARSALTSLAPANTERRREKIALTVTSKSRSMVFGAATAEVGAEVGTLLTNAKPGLGLYVSLSVGYTLGNACTQSHGSQLHPTHSTEKQPVSSLVQANLHSMAAPRVHLIASPSDTKIESSIAAKLEFTARTSVAPGA